MMCRKRIIRMVSKSESNWKIAVLMSVGMRYNLIMRNSWSALSGKRDLPIG